MPQVDWTIDGEIGRAATLPAAVYSDPAWLAAARASGSLPGAGRSSPTPTR